MDLPDFLNADSTEKWGDDGEDDDGDDDDLEEEIEEEAPPPKKKFEASVTKFETPCNKDGIKTITELRTDEQGVKTKTVRKVQVTKKTTRVNRNVAARRKWAKFGDLINMPPGPDPGHTYFHHDTITLNLRPKKREEQQDDVDDPFNKLKPDSSIVVCRNCGETGHWTLKCPRRGEINMPGALAGVPDPRAGARAAVGAGKYVPMHLRAGARPTAVREEDSNSLRVTNISENTNEDDLRELFRTCGHTQRIYLAKDRNTGLSRGFAFVSYHTHAEAQKAIDRLDGHGYDNLILHVEFSKPREEDPNRVKPTPTGSAFRSNF